MNGKISNKFDIITYITEIHIIECLTLLEVGTLLYLKFTCFRSILIIVYSGTIFKKKLFTVIVTRLF